MSSRVTTSTPSHVNQTSTFSSETVQTTKVRATAKAVLNTTASEGGSESRRKKRKSQTEAATPSPASAASSSAFTPFEDLYPSSLTEDDDGPDRPDPVPPITLKPQTEEEITEGHNKACAIQNTLDLTKKKKSSGAEGTTVHELDFLHQEVQKGPMGYEADLELGPAIKKSSITVKDVALGFLMIIGGILLLAGVFAFGQYLIKDPLKFSPLEGYGSVVIACVGAVVMIYAYKKLKNAERGEIFEPQLSEPTPASSCPPRRNTLPKTLLWAH